MPEPLRGEVWMVDLGMAAKVRPCVVISVDVDDTERALATAIPHTTSPRGTRFEVAIRVPSLRPGVFDVQNLITIPFAKYIRRLGSLSEEQMVQIEDTLRMWLGLSPITEKEHP